MRSSRRQDAEVPEGESYYISMTDMMVGVVFIFILLLSFFALQYHATTAALTKADEDVPSPTFTLVQFYEGPDFPVAHFDLYRLARAEEAYEIGLDEALEDGAAVIEWPQRLEGRLPPDRLDIEIALDDGGRVARLTPHGAWEGRPLEF